jgi:hypothetical protein
MLTGGADSGGGDGGGGGGLLSKIGGILNLFKKSR